MVEKTMSNLEMKLQHMEQIESLNRNELDIKTRQISQIFSVIDNHIQRLDDTFITTHDPKTKETVYKTVLAMRNLREDISAVVKEE